MVHDRVRLESGHENKKICEIGRRNRVGVNACSRRPIFIYYMHKTLIYYRRLCFSANYNYLEDQVTSFD